MVIYCVCGGHTEVTSRKADPCKARRENPEGEVRRQGACDF